MSSSIDPQYLQGWITLSPNPSYPYYLTRKIIARERVKEAEAKIEKTLAELTLWADGMEAMGL